jgi:hypothetical protein
MVSCYLVYKNKRTSSILDQASVPKDLLVSFGIFDSRSSFESLQVFISSLWLVGITCSTHVLSTKAGMWWRYIAEIDWYLTYLIIYIDVLISKLVDVSNNKSCARYFPPCPYSLIDGGRNPQLPSSQSCRKKGGKRQITSPAPTSIEADGPSVAFPVLFDKTPTDVQHWPTKKDHSVKLAIIRTITSR